MPAQKEHAVSHGLNKRCDVKVKEAGQYYNITNDRVVLTHLVKKEEEQEKEGGGRRREGGR